MNHEQCKAVALLETGGDCGKLVVRTDYAVPEPREGELLVEVVSAALNMIDLDMVCRGKHAKRLPCVPGVDVAGIVTRVGPGVTGWRQGDHLIGVTRAGKTGAGTFAEYCIVEAEMAAHKPTGITFQNAATAGLPFIAAGLTMYWHLGMPFPGSMTTLPAGKWMLVWGATGCVGAYVVQMAAMAGFRVIAVGNRDGFERLEGIGAEHTIDYQGADPVARVREITGNDLCFAVDCVSATTAAKCLEAMSTDPSEYGYFVAVNGLPQRAPAHIRTFSIDVMRSFDIPSERLFVGEIYRRLLPFVERGQIKSLEYVELDGLDSIEQGLLRLKDDVHSGCKLVATLNARPMSI